MRYRLKSFLGKGQGWRIGGESYWPGDDPPGYLFGSTSGRNKPDSSLNQSHVGFSSGNDLVGLQGNFCSAAKCLSVRSSYDRFVAEAESHDEVLEFLQHLAKLVPLSLLGCRGHIDQVRANTEVSRLVADHQADPSVTL